MLITVIYRSHLRSDVSYDSIDKMVRIANERNLALEVTGVLLFNGRHFLQLLEGPEEQVRELYHKICGDHRHFNIVELMWDYAPFRRFGNAGMELIDTRLHAHEECLKAVLDRGTTRHQLLYNDRSLRFFRTFIESTEKDSYYELPEVTTWTLSAERIALCPSATREDYVLKPVVDPLERKIHSFEFLLVNGVTEHHTEPCYADLEVKVRAFTAAGSLLEAQQRVSVHLHPLTLVKVEGAVDFLLEMIRSSSLVPSQVIIEFTESEIISRVEEFTLAVGKLKAAGINIAINDFGAGYAGLLLLTRFQPDKVKIYAELIRDIHRDGSRQAIVRSLIRCCDTLEIRICATGIEHMEEWMWLESAGISFFQGDLFSSYSGKEGLVVRWPDPV